MAENKRSAASAEALGLALMALLILAYTLLRHGDAIAWSAR